jgi:hypothetical protein
MKWKCGVRLDATSEEVIKTAMPVWEPRLDVVSVSLYIGF